MICHAATVLVLLSILYASAAQAAAGVASTPAAADGAVAAAAEAAAAAPDGAWWRPRQGLQFQYQLSQKFDPARDFILGVQVYFLDGFDTTADVVAALKARGGAAEPVYPVCYISAGTREDWRPDAGEFVEEDIGAPLGAWPGENYINVRSERVRDIMRKRMEMCRSKGFAAVDPDNTDAYLNQNGLGLTSSDQLEYNAWLAVTAHDLGLAVGLKNDMLQVDWLEPAYDFFVNEGCHKFSECQYYTPALAAGKPVWNIEYEEGPFRAACANKTMGPSTTTIYKNQTLGFCRHGCSSSNLDCPNRGDGAGAARADARLQLLGILTACLLAAALPLGGSW